MDWGMNNRISKIIKPKSGKTLMLAVDHGYFMGPTTGLEQVGKAVKDLIPHADTLMLTRGILRHDIDSKTDIPIVLRVSGGTSILSQEFLHEGITASMKEAIRLNVAGVAFSITVGAKWERNTILGLSQVVNEAEDHGIPVIAVTAVGKELTRDTRYLGLASRIAAEHGARIVKTYYCEGFEKVVDACPVPIVIAGGKKLPEKDALEMAYNAIHAGAVGVDMGRNIFQSEDPVTMIRAVKEIVHSNATAREAFEMFEREKKAKPV
ncbi:MAG: 3-hydroxy-5-phosphonooxypentane-2,4-dione thiolase [Candidatus Aenigmatarchaeota archaeon]|nr:3-hydroxy-5-phosphonooxypentane-2,4-dione thiolase [Nanoarchaeota archaeon]